MKNVLEIKVVNDYRDIDKNQWDKLSNSPFTCYNWIKTLEESKIISIKPHYILVYDKNELIAFAMSYIQTNELYNTISKALLGKLENSPLKFNPCLLCYSPISITEKGIEISPEYKNKTKEITDLVLRQMEEIAKKNKLKYYGFLNLTNEEKEVDSVLKKSKFNKCFTCYSASIDTDYPSLDKYLKSLNHRKRYAFNKENKRNKRFDMKAHASSDIDVSEFFPTLRTIQKKHHHNENIIKNLENFLTLLQKNFKEEMVIFSDTQNDEIVSVVICIKSKNSLIGLKSGKRDQYDKATTVSYFGICYVDLVKYAIKNGLKTVSLGTGAYLSKTTRKSKLKPLYLYLKSTSKILQFYLKVILPIISHRKRKKHQKQAK